MSSKICCMTLTRSAESHRFVQLASLRGLVAEDGGLDEGSAGVIFVVEGRPATQEASNAEWIRAYRNPPTSRGRRVPPD